jgi:hypothetical protein
VLSGFAPSVEAGFEPALADGSGCEVGLLETATIAEKWDSLW